MKPKTSLGWGGEKSKNHKRPTPGRSNGNSGNNSGGNNNKPKIHSKPLHEEEDSPFREGDGEIEESEDNIFDDNEIEKTIQKISSNLDFGKKNMNSGPSASIPGLDDGDEYNPQDDLMEKAFWNNRN